MQITSTDIVIVAGQRGSGKTTLAKGLIESTEPEFQRTHGYGFDRIDPLLELGGEFVRYGDRITFNKKLQEWFELKNRFIVVDESDGFFPNKQTLTRWENDFIQIGRHWGLGGIFMTRRFPKLHTDLVSNANKLFIFKLWNRADLNHLKDSGLSQAVDFMEGLQPYEFVSIDLTTGETLINDPI